MANERVKQVPAVRISIPSSNFLDALFSRFGSNPRSPALIDRTFGLSYCRMDFVLIPSSFLRSFGKLSGPDNSKSLPVTSALTECIDRALKSAVEV